MFPLDINAPDSVGKTPLHNAILGKHFNIVDLLLKSGADVKCLDERGDTPLHAAVRVDSEAIVVVRKYNVVLVIMILSYFSLGRTIVDLIAAS